MSKVDIIANEDRFEELKEALNKIGITGMTVTNVYGYGMQKGHTTYYRGAEMDTNLLPKTRIEIIVSSVPVERVVEAARKVLYTGHVGDGKIFVYDVENVIRISTGDSGSTALDYSDSAETVV
ncbi:MAG: P-II family nitrogen regulator [Desemzia incerta]